MAISILMLHCTTFIQLLIKDEAEPRLSEGKKERTTSGLFDCTSEDYILETRGFNFSVMG